MSGAARRGADTIVVKLGGEVAEGPVLGAIAADLEALRAEGHRVVVTHGGGPQTTRLQRRLGLEPTILGGRRLTDEATLEIVQMSIVGKVHVDLCARLRGAGLPVVGLHDAVRATRRPPQVVSGAGPDPIDLGLVGDPTSFDLDLLELLLGAGRVPVLACLGVGQDGAVYNINADRVANGLAGALGAAALVLVTSTPGVLRDLRDPSTRIPRLTVDEGRRAIAEGIIAGGMVPKVEDSFAALALGAHAIHIVASDLARAIREPGSVGTVLVP